MRPQALPIVYWLFVAGICAAIGTAGEREGDVVHLATNAEVIRAMIRATAFTSAVPFFVVFVTSTAHYFLRSPATRWLMANRRYVGLSVAASHFWHLVAIVLSIRWYPGADPIEIMTIIFGGSGFVLLGLMAATSNDASQRALGFAWRVLHKIGVYVLWIDFIYTYSGAATASPFHAAMTLLFALAWMARVVAFVTARQDARRARLASA